MLKMTQFGPSCGRADFLLVATRTSWIRSPAAKQAQGSTRGTGLPQHRGTGGAHRAVAPAPAAPVATRLVNARPKSSTTPTASTRCEGR